MIPKTLDGETTVCKENAKRVPASAKFPARGSLASF